MIAQSAVIARASMRVLTNHVTIGLGGPRRAAVALAALLGVVVTLDVSVYLFLKSNLGDIFSAAAASSVALDNARQSLIQSTAITAAAIALIFLMFTPAESHLGLTARVAGADRRAIALGQFIPVLAAIFTVVTFGNLGVTVFVAQTQRDPVAVIVGLTALGAAYTAVVLTLHQGTLAIARALGIPFMGARLLGLCVAFSLVGAVLIELITATARGGPSTLTHVTDFLWRGEDLPRTAAEASITVLASVVLLGALLGCSAITAESDRVTAAPLFSVPLTHRPEAITNFVARETLMSIRHPVTQLTLATSVLFSSLLLAGTLAGLIPAGISLAGLALLMSAGLEIARGRTRDYDWVVRLAGYPAWRRVLAQFCGCLIPGAMLFAIALALIWASLRLPAGDLGGAALMVLLLASLAYLSGVLLPFSPTVPSGMLLTALVAVGLDGIALWCRARVASYRPSLGPVFDGALTAAVLLCSWLVIRTQTRPPTARATLSCAVPSEDGDSHPFELPANEAVISGPVSSREDRENH